MVGLEALPTHAQQARAMASELGLRNVEVIEGDIRSSDLPSDSFDVVHCRTVLNAIAAPQAVVEEMVRLTKPGGWVAAHEPDWLTLLCEPSHPSWDRLHALVMGIWKDDGADAFLGRRLQGMLRAAGLQDVAGSVHIDIRPKGHARRSVLQDFVRNLRDRILTERLVPEVELDEHLRSVDDHLSDRNTLVLGAMFFPAWGRKPADAS